MEQPESDDIYRNPELLLAALTGGNPDLPVPAFPSFSKVKREVSDRVRDIFSSWNALNSLLERYEEVLRKRWGKKTATQRRAILLTAWPNMPATHRPDFQAFKHETTQQRRQGSRFRDCFLIPLINLEDLIKVKTLLLLLNTRGRNQPDIFVNADFNAAHLGQVSQAIIPDYLNGYTMLLSGQKEPSTYGQLLSWDENLEAFDLMSSGVGIQPGEGLVVLEVQQKLLRFLVHIVKLILRDLPLDDMSVPIQPPPPVLGSGNSDTEWTSLATVSLEGPYRVPDQLDFLRMQSLVYAKCAQTKDHVWSLREDPAYFSDVVGAWGEHRQENILSVNGKNHPVRRLPLFWERVLGSVLVDAYGNMFAWNLIWRQLTQLGELKDQHAVESFQSLPQDFEQALAHFSYLLEQACTVSRTNLRMGMVASPPLRQYYSREPQDPNTTRIQVAGKPRSREDHLLWLLEKLLEEEPTRLFGLHNILDEVERVVQNDVKERERITSWVADILSDLAILGELQRQLSLARPGVPMTLPVTESNLKAKLAKDMISVIKIHDAFKANYRLADVYMPLQRVNYPSDKRRTRETTEQMRKVEKDLFFFWRRADDHVLKQTRETIQDLLPEIGQRVPKRTPIWIVPTAKNERTNVAAVAEAFSITDLEESTERTLSPVQALPVKSKTKTRGVGSESVGEDSIVEDVMPAQDPLPKFTVSKRDYKVYSTLFRSPTEDGVPGELPWTDFLHALSSVGFSVEKLDGSAWIFRPSHEAPERSIIFHEPHPSSKIPFRMARRYGRRLERAYGWTGETFVKAI